MPVVFLFVYGHLSCTRLKGYFWTVPKMEVLMADSSRNAGKIEKINMEGVPEQLVFGLDIGTRSVVGIIGYKNNDGTFVVVAQVSVEHQIGRASCRERV